eukprot:TRINITY_DN1668_c1_g1_i1.p1 TRINITY_DN1668_c1_g1~~TRINITY_DN1668_c1_g1_i1.p1  ORF type:complete len:489 (+),score=125.01 TRINITY_DN1668_c1_g1_i1:50-1516(+)
MQSVFMALALAAVTPERMSTRGRWIIDESGRVRLFHGFNDIGHAKGGEYMPGATMLEANLDVLEKGGFNGFRMPMMWAGANPREGYLNDSYITQIRTQVERMGARGMYSFLDMHQDVLSTRFHSYDGAPRWLVNKTNPRHPYPWPLPSPLSNWAEGYLTEACGQAFEDIYDNRHGGRTAWIEFWTRVATLFKDTKATLGYELINEPWAGDVYLDPLLITPEQAGKHNLLPSYDKLVESIRTVDNNTIVFFEPVTWGMVLPGNNITLVGNGFDHIPGGPQNADKSVFSWHYYCWMLNSDYSNSSAPYKPALKVECDDALGPLIFSTVIKDVEKLGVASFLTEFGALTPNANEPDSEGTQEIESVLREADRSLQSWTFWDIAGLIDGSMNLRYEKVVPFIRPFAQATAGIPESMDYNNNTKSFSFVYTAKSSIPAPTEIVVPDEVYPSLGFDVKVTPSTVTHTLCPRGSAPVLCFTSPSDGIVSVHITRK